MQISQQICLLMELGHDILVIVCLGTFKILLFYNKNECQP